MLTRSFWRVCALLPVPLWLSCQESLPEPEGPLVIKRLTLLDGVSRDNAVFTDTSAPADCTAAPVRDTERCQIDPFKDTFSQAKSPPTPDSGADIRVVFNKLPLQFRGADLERIERDADGKLTSKGLRDPSVLELRCEGCTEVPPHTKLAALSGSDTSPDPTTFAYGPAIQISVTADDKHPFAALEPSTTYQVVVSQELADRQGNKLATPDAALLRFTTEPFRVLQVGIGDHDHDEFVYGEADLGTPQKPYQIGDLPTDGVVVVRLNTALDPAALRMTTATATVSGRAVPVKVGPFYSKKDDKGMAFCDSEDQRGLFVFPATMDGTWGSDKGGTLRVVLKGGEIRDLSQAAMHPAEKGRHTLSNDVVLEAKLTGDKASDKYPGLLSSSVRAASDCP